MAEVVITLKLTASEYQTLREELAEAKKSLDAEAKAHRDSGALGQGRTATSRSARLAFILEKLG